MRVKPGGTLDSGYCFLIKIPILNKSEFPSPLRIPLLYDTGVLCCRVYKRAFVWRGNQL